MFEVLFLAKVLSLSATVLMVAEFYRFWRVLSRSPFKLRGKWRALPVVLAVFSGGYATCTVFVLLGDEALISTVFLYVVPWLFLFGALMVNIATGILLWPRLKLREMLDVRPVIQPGDGPSILQAATSYVVDERRPAVAFELMAREIRSGRPGLVVSRLPPQRLRERYALGQTPAIWLSTVWGKAHVHPQRADVLFEAVLGFMEGSPRAVVLFEGIELLCGSNGFKETLALVDKLKDNATVTDATLILALDGWTFDARELALVERGCEPWREGKPLVPPAPYPAAEGPMGLVETRFWSDNRA